MRAILISAGQGTRLIPLTRDVPKCLVPVNGHAMLDWQLDAFHRTGIGEVVIVGGYRAGRIDAHIATLPAAARPRLIFNPFWAVSSSIGSVWAARAFLDEPFCLLNGDTIFTPGLLADALERAGPGVNLVVEHAPVAEHDDMRVAVEDGRVHHVGKDLSPEAAHYRSLGMIICGDGGSADYLNALDEVIGGEDGHLRYHHDVIDRIAATGTVAAIATSGHDWLEIDCPDDIDFWKQRHPNDASP